GWSVGENIAWGSGTLSSPAGIVAAWMASPGHKENLLNPTYREIGIGIVPGSPRSPEMAGAATYTTDFGTRR
ncbi:MAG TPA: CAP domain-containing protein, partial [Solirubrobacteraceae bacterium]|nr:CAP domain-containing protein [Solirubrobacteraceae bacterium]